MARDPDTLETTTGDQHDEDASREPVMEFTTPPARAERTMPREGRNQPLWPWLVLVALVVAAGLVYAAVS
jgi:uncharacterized protein HemX